MLARMARSALRCAAASFTLRSSRTAEHEHRRAADLSRPLRSLRSPDAVRQPIVRPQGVLRMIVPPVLAPRSTVGVERIDDAVVGFGPFAHHQQADLGFGVVEEGVRDPRAGGKSNCIARLQSMEMAVEPDVGLAVDDVDKLFLGAFGVREGGAPTRR